MNVSLSRIRRAAASALLACCLACLGLPAQAHATCNLGQVSVSMQSSVSVDSGDVAQVAVACDPAFSDQYPNCMNDYCPSGCDFGMENSSGTGCQDKSNGQCTCFGYNISRYYPSCTVASSNPAVALATWSDGMLSVRGYRAGTATLTVTPALRLFTGVPGTIQVTVNEAPAAEVAVSSSSAVADSSQSGALAPSGSASADRSAAASRGRSESGSSSSSSPVATPVDSGAGTQLTSGVSSIISLIGQSESGEDAAGDTVLSNDGVLSSDAVYHLGDEDVDVPGILRDAAGSDKVLTFWSGANAEAPDYVVEVPASQLDDDGDYSVTLQAETVSDDELVALAADDGAGDDADAGAEADGDVSGVESLDGDEAASAGSGDGSTPDEGVVAFRMDDGKKLPATVQMFWRATDDFANGSHVSVYSLKGSGDEARLDHVHDNVEVGEGYACFNLSDGGVYVMSQDASLSLPVSSAGPIDELALDSGAEPAQGEPFVLPLWAIPIGAVVIAGASWMTYYMFNRRRVPGCDGHDDETGTAAVNSHSDGRDDFGA